MLRKIASANLTRSGSMVIHTRAPFTVAQLICEESAIQASLRSMKWKGDLLKPTLELDVPWHGVVVHGIPAAPLWDAWNGNGQNIWDNLLQDNRILPGNVKDTRILCWDEEVESKEQISLRLMFEDTNLACQVLSDGAFLFGSRCWVSQYRHRKQRNHLQSSSTTPPEYGNSQPAPAPNNTTLLPALPHVDLVAMITPLIQFTSASHHH